MTASKQTPRETNSVQIGVIVKSIWHNEIWNKNENFLSESLYAMHNELHLECTFSLCHKTNEKKNVKYSILVLVHDYKKSIIFFFMLPLSTLQDFLHKENKKSEL